MDTLPLARVFSVENAPATAKIVHLLRHAQGTHNIAEDNGRSLQHWDACLTDHGVRQCHAIRAGLMNMDVACILVSPTTRTLQTAQHVFQDALKAGVPCVAQEAFRETVNFCCDARRTVPELYRDFPFADFSHLENETDPIWAHYMNRFGDHLAFTECRETADFARLHQRLRLAVSAISQRPEQNIVVVTHNAFLMHLFDVYSSPGIIDFADPAAKSLLQAPFDNCEMRTAAFDFSPSL